MKAIIVDDEKSNRELLHLMLRDFCSYVNVVGESANAAEAAEQINKLNPDLIFLDIEMPGGSGFDLLKSLPNRKFEVIFVTAYNQYAILAFKFSAIDYLLKPLNPDELIEAVEKAKKKKDSSIPLDSIKVLLENIQHTSAPPKKIIIPDSEGFITADVERITRLEAEGSYTNVFLQNGTRLVATRTLSFFEELLKLHTFCRIHNSHLVNLNFVTKYNKGRGGTVIMIDGAEIEVSRRKKEEFLEKMGGKLSG